MDLIECRRVRAWRELGRQHQGWKDLLEGLRVGLPDSFEDREADLVGVCDGFEDRGVDLVGFCDCCEDREVGRVKKLRSLESVVKIEGWKDMSEGLRLGVPDSFQDREVDLVGFCDSFEDREVDLVRFGDCFEDREVGRAKK